MDIQTLLGPAIILGVIFAVIGVSERGRKKYQKRQRKTVALLESNEAAYASKSGLLCSSFDEPENGLVQFFGTILSADLRPGMALCFQDGIPWMIKAIYLDRHNPDVTSSLASAHTKDAAIVVETHQNFNKKLFKDQLDQAGFVFLKLS